MISATILSVDVKGSSVSLRYRLTDDQNPGYVDEGALGLSLSDTPATISTTLAAIVDTANFAQSLQPLVNTQVTSKNPVPIPVIPAQTVGLG